MTAGGYQIGEDTLARIRGWIAKYPSNCQRSAVVPALWLVQKEAGGHVPAAAVTAVAELLDMAPIRVAEIVSFYSMFNTEPVGTFFIQVCGTTPCRLCGAAELIDVCTERIGPAGGLSSCGRFSWIEVECLGACVNAPMMQIGDDYHERLTADDFDTLLDQLEKDGASSLGRIGAVRGSDSGLLTDPALYDGSRSGIAALPNVPGRWGGRDAG